MPEVSGDLITRNYSNFRGVDFSNTEVALYRSPDAINMWKDYKKMGTSIETRPDIVLFKELKNTVYGLFFYTINQVDHMIIHCGVSLYDYNMKTKELKIIKEKGMNIRKSQSFIYRNILYIKDGLNYLQYDGETCKEVIGYIPVTRRGSDPAGKGSTAQETNLLTGVRENSFCADGESTEYVLDASELDAGYQEKVFINDVEKTEGFTVDKVSGKVKFTTAPEKPLTDGQDNVVIRFSKTIPGNRDKINKCTILEVFDNRVFFSGNQDYPNTVFHTMLDEPKYCSDLDYYNEGADISPVRGMVAGNNALWVIKEPSQANTAIFYHNPTIDSEAGKVYPSEHSSISTGCIGAAINFNDDIVYFSNRGMEGISGDITTEQVISHRSSLVDSKLLQEKNYKDMILVEYEGYLLVIIKDKIYLADSRAMFTNENHNEYEWFYWNIDIEPTCAVVYNGELWLGSKQGIFKIGKASENNKEISMEKDEEERYFINGVTKQETGVESYKTVTGKEILIEDGENNKGLEIKVKGSTTQATRSGKNLFNLNNIRNAPNVFTVTETGVNLTNDWAGDVFTFENIAKTFKANTTYTMKAKAKVVSRPSTITDINDNIFLFYRPASDELGHISKSILEIPDKRTIALNTEKEYITSFTTPEDMTNVRFLSYTFRGNNDGSTTGTALGEIDVSEIMLVEGSYTAETFPEYEQYGASPSPDYPAKIENVEGNVEIKDIGENLYNKKDISGTRMAEVKINELTAGTYTLSALATSSDTDRTQCLVLDATNNKNLGYLNRNVRSSFTFTLEKPTKKLIFYASTTYNLGENDTFKFADIQIEQKTMATSYKPYQEQKVDFPLSEGQKLYEGSYLASDGIHHKRKQIVLNGTEGIANVYVNTSTTRFGFSLSLTPDKKIGLDNVLSTHFKCDTTVYYDSQTQVGICGNARNVNIYIRVNGNITTDEFKTWLATQYANGTPVILEYELSEEEIVAYTEAQQEAWDKIESMKLYDGVNHIESTSEIDIKYNYIYKKPSIKNKSNIENKISSGEYQTIINNKRYFVFLEEELKSVRNDITDRLYIDTNKNIAKVMKRVDKLVLNGTEEWNVNATHSNVFYTAKPKNMADNETNIFCTITDEFSKDLSGETYGILIDTNINIKIPKVKTVADLKAYLAKEPITIQYKATEEIKDIILLSKPSSYWTTCEDEFKYPQMQKTTNKRGCVADVIGEEIDVFCKTNKEQFEKIATHKNSTGYAVNRIKKKKWKSIQLKFSSNKSFELFSCTLESYIGSYIKR